MRTVSIIHAAVLCIAVMTAPATAWGTSAKDVFAEVAGAVVVVLPLDTRGETIAQGSGVVVGEYEVVTNCHVLEKATSVDVRQAADWSGGESYRMAASLLARNDERDLCLLFTEELPAPPAAKVVFLGTAKSLSVGDEVYAVGAPAGLELSLSRGVVSQLRGVFGKRSAPLVQTDAAISPGSSGGGLFNQAGELVGITTFKREGESLNFAMPAEWVEDLRAQGRLELAKAKRGATCRSNPEFGCVVELALYSANSIDDPLIRSDRLRDIAATQAAFGDVRGAQQTLAALTLLADSETNISRIAVFAEVAVAQAKIGVEKSARETLDSLHDATHHFIADPSHVSPSQALAYLASAQARAGIIAEALETSRSIFDSREYKDRSSVLRTIAAAQAEAGDIQNARITAMSIEDNKLRNVALVRVADAQSRVGTFEDAAKTLMSVDDEDLRTLGFFRISAWQLASGQQQLAERTLVSIHASGESNKVLGNLFGYGFLPMNLGIRVLSAIIQAKNGDFAAALGIADSLDIRARNGSAHRVRLLCEVAVMQARAGKGIGAIHTLNAALAAARTHSNTRDRAVLISAVAAAQARAGHPEVAPQTFAEALRIARSINAVWRRAYVLKNISTAQAEAGHLVNAMTTALSIPEMTGNRGNSTEIVARLSPRADFIEYVVGHHRLLFPEEMTNAEVAEAIDGEYGSELSAAVSSLDGLGHRSEALMLIARHLVGRSPLPWWYPRSTGGLW